MLAGNSVATINSGHVKNPKQVKYLNAKLSGYDPTLNDPKPPGGVDITGVYRDPWGNPYIISMDLNYDEQCEDAFYCPRTEFSVTGKSLNKDEFVTCGGVKLGEINFKTMASKVCPGLFFAGDRKSVV